MTNESTEGKDKPAAEKADLQMISSLADITGWEIGPTKESDSALTIKVIIKNWEDVKVIRKLAAGQVVIRVLPLQLSLSEPVGCLHPKDAQMPFMENHSVCLNCGTILDVAPDDQAAPASS